jgi:hypothetical protein
MISILKIFAKIIKKMTKHLFEWEVSISLPALYHVQKMTE